MFNPEVYAYTIKSMLVHLYIFVNFLNPTQRTKTLIQSRLKMTIVTIVLNLVKIDTW